MTKIGVYISLAANTALLVFSYIAIDEIDWDNDWDSWGWDRNIFLILVFMTPLTTFFLAYLSLREDALEYIKLTLQRRRLESERKIIETKLRIKELQSKQ